MHTHRLVQRPVWATLATALLLLDDVIQQQFTAANQAEFELRYVAVLWLFALAMTLLGRRWLLWPLLALLAAMQLVQLGNIAFAGEPLAPAELVSLFGQPGEVWQSARHHWQDHWPVLLAVGLPYGVLAWLLARLPPPAPRWQLVGGLLVLAVLLAKPYRATYRDMDAFMPGPTRSSLHNSLNAFAFYAVRLAGRDQPALSLPAPRPYQVQPVASQARHVWVVMVDSLRGSRLGVLGYPRATTPQLAATPGLLARPGIAAGVATAVSLPSFVNLVSHPGQHHLLRQQPYNLFRLARQQGFRTLWLSSQESKLLANLGSPFMDVRISREDHPLLFRQQHDHALPRLLARQQLGQRSFVMLNLRTAHSPYQDNYRHAGARFARWPTDASLPYATRKSNAYDNAVLYADDVLGEIIRQFEALPGERYLLITGDHGQLLGEGGRWGHNDLQPEVADVPVLLLARQAPPAAAAELAAQSHISHYEAGVWLAARLGYQVRNPLWRDGEHYLLGKLLWQDNPLRPLREQGGALQFAAPVLLSHWLQRQTGRDAVRLPAVFDNKNYGHN